MIYKHLRRKNNMDIPQAGGRAGRENQFLLHILYKHLNRERLCINRCGLQNCSKTLSIPCG